MIRTHYLAAILTIAAFPAAAVPIQTWNFTGVCSDCPGNGTGVLIVDQATVNGPLTFQFSYSSAWISYTLTNPAVFIGGAPFSGTSFSIPTTTTMSMQQVVPITSFGGVGNPLGTPGVYNDGIVNFFYRPTTNFWSSESNSFVSDFGTNPTWTPAVPNTGVPEPSSVALIGLGLAGLGFTARRRKLQRS